MLFVILPLKHDLVTSWMPGILNRSVYELRNDTKMLQVATTCELLKTKTRIHVNGIYISPSICQKALPTNAMSCNIGPESALLPGLPDDVAKHCLALVPRNYFQSMGSVCKLWRKFLQSKEFYVVRKLAGSLEEWIESILL